MGHYSFQGITTHHRYCSRRRQSTAGQWLLQLRISMYAADVIIDDDAQPMTSAMMLSYVRAKRRYMK